MKTINIYVATDIKGIGKKKGRYIYLLETETSKGLATIHDIKEIEATRDIAELTALVTAVRRLKQHPADLNVYVNSEQLKLNIMHYLQGWAKRNFCKQDGRRLSCWELWKALWDNTRIFDLRVYNKTHSYTNWLLKELENGKINLRREIKNNAKS